ncbi:hypothetical protein GOP47_0000717 [Adiantum capillus-veneris]|uniref:Uncharacterized protein n=1 Tax=Adiantum capillus-veneris TaxID=13818 RepID=A0A9D4ZQZ2_ADICA|nr:hypothetical protein GOP47_0000717 [Adiantum capillus-veneris]
MIKGCIESIVLVLYWNLNGKVHVSRVHKFCLSFECLKKFIENLGIVGLLIFHLYFQGHDGKEWKRVGQDISRFLKADAPCQNSRPLRYSVLLDPLPTSFPSPSRLGGRKPLNLKDAVLVSYHQNEVKFAELTLDTFRFLQCLEWEPSGSFFRSRVNESNGSAAAASMRVDDIMDQSLPPNPHKYILHRPSILQLLLVLATACEELPADSIILLYLSALGKSSSTGAMQLSIPISKASASTSFTGLENNIIMPSDHSEGTLEVNDISPSSSPDRISVTGGDTVSLDLISLNAGLWFGSRADAGVSFLCPADLFPFTRKPLFIIIDSDRSNLFEVIHGEERGEPSALLLSPTLRPCGESGDHQERGTGSFFTFFLTAPLLAFCQLVSIPTTNLAQGTNEQLQKLLTSAIVEWGKLLSVTALDLVWVRVMWDPFLRQLLLRFIFCRACLALHRDYGGNEEYLPHCLPSLPRELLPTEAAIEGQVYQIASHIGVVDQFKFPSKIADLEGRLESLNLTD